MESTTSHDAPTAVQPALSTVAGDRCTSCGAPLAPDQRYCVQCGQRRGQSQLPAAPTATAAAPPPRTPRHQRWGVNTALIAGVGTLLLAMGVGVLIGRSGQHDSQAGAAKPVQVVTVGGGAGAPAVATAAGAGGAKAAKASKKSGKGASTAATAAAAKKIKGTNITLPKKAVVKVGSPGTGPGYQHGKFTGNFFGGG